MAVQPAAKLTAIPEFPSLARRATGEYNGMAYNFGTHMGGDGPFVSEINALAGNVQHNAQEAVDAAGGSSDAQEAAEAARDAAADSAGAADGFSRNSAASASASADSAAAAADSDIAAAAQARLADDARVAAQGARDDTAGMLGEVQEARSETLAYRDQAEVFASGQLKGSSSSSVTPGAGARAFAMEPSRSFVQGMYLVATSVSDSATWMSGYVQSYNPTSGALVIGVDMFSGVAAKADWVIGVAAPGAASGLTRQVVTANTTCVAGVAYIVAAAGITLTLPASWAAGDKIAFIEAIGNGAIYNVAWGSTPLRGRAMGTQQMSAMYGGSNGALTYQDATRGLV
ncbi:hypothetical protein [Delftia acidovorans]|uniref:hypothetical protein n=1 Tax=Delftia acidovorans TaxID=80866 RepID=UPI003D0E9507